MRLIIMYLIASILWISCRQEQNTDEIPADLELNDTTQLKAIRYLALGDSYTIGESVTFQQRWPVQLGKVLEPSDYTTEVEIIAQTGWITGQLVEAIQSQNPEGPYDLVSLLIGVNNQFRGLDTADYRIEFRNLLQAAISFAGGDTGHVFVVSIPDYSVTPFAQNMDTARIAREIDAFNAINNEETQIAGIAYIDITPISRRAKTNPALLANDGLHPSGTMYSEWVELIGPVALEMVQP